MIQYDTFADGQIENAWATIGMYDGVHRGHQAILLPLIAEAHAAGSPAVVVTFHPHPVEVLRGLDEPLYLTAPDERARLLGDLGADAVITLTFDRALASLSAEEFMQRMSRALGLRQLWVGDDFALGRNRQGTLPVLESLGEQMGYRLHVTHEVRAAEGGNNAGGRISSSAIRALLRDGKAGEAARMLGRPYSVEGPVVHGDGRGRQLGFPTANVHYWPKKVIPAYGVYATWTWVGGERIASVSSVGVRPTFDPPGSPARVEAYLIDYTGDLYGQHARVEFLEFLRPELRFDTAQALIEQMELDTQNAREVFAHAA